MVHCQAAWAPPPLPFSLASRFPATQRPVGLQSCGLGRASGTGTAGSQTSQGLERSPEGGARAAEVGTPACRCPEGGESVTGADWESAAGINLGPSAQNKAGIPHQRAGARCSLFPRWAHYNPLPRSPSGVAGEGSLPSGAAHLPQREGGQGGSLLRPDRPALKA